jgi:hypothetical protein
MPLDSKLDPYYMVEEEARKVDSYEAKKKCMFTRIVHLRLARRNNKMA